ncbi:MAG: ATP-binding cassette domain-containing protein [Candidatus Shapirobacteria bacterium]
MEKDSIKEKISTNSEVVDINKASFVSYDKVLFYDASFKIHKGEIVSVIGESGSGKSVLLQIIAGKLPLDEGEVKRSNSTEASYVPQNIEQINVDGNITVRDFYYSARELVKINQKKEELESVMANGNYDQQILRQYENILNDFEYKGGYTADFEIEKILEGMKISEKHSGHINLNTKIGEISSGQHTRLLIGRALFSSSDLLILDDPTSHLDVDTVNWLVDFLKKRDQGILIATQNIDFAEKCANRIVEITSFGRVLTFKGKYSEYVIKRDSILESEKKAADSALEKYKKLEATYLKFKNAGVYKKSKDMAQVGNALESRLERMKENLNEMPGVRKVFREDKIKEVSFIQSNENINPAIHISGIKKSYDDKHVALDIKNTDFFIKRKQILAITGNNGSGKSTLMRMINDSANRKNEFVPDKGEIFVEKGLKVGYIAPDYLEIPKKGNVFHFLLESMQEKNEAEATKILTFFGFSHQNIRLRTIETISSGEKKQLALAKIMAQRPDILLLDEPADNLKSDLIEGLIKAINKYEGTTIIISHNKDFINRLDVDLVLELSKDKVSLKEISK